MVLLKTKKNTILILLIVFCILFAGAGGYLLWRVNQEDSLGPGDSDAGGGGGEGCSAAATAACYAQCGSTNGFITCEENGKPCGTVACGTAKRCHCCDGRWVTVNSGSCSDACSGNGGQYGDCDGDTPVVKCSCASWSDGCGTNCTFPSGTQSSVNSAAKKDCAPKVAMCNVSSGQISIQDYGPGHPCYGKLSQCKNPYADNPCTETKNVCDSGSWNKKPSGQYNYCDPIEYDALAKDSDGIDANTISVKLNGQGRSSYKKSESATQTTISETLSTSSKCLEPGTYTLDLSWKDKKGNASSACTLTTTFTIGEPGWSVQKNVVESCIDEKTSSPKARLSYVIAVKNLSQSSRKITKIVDNLDPKVRKDQMGSISKGGTFSNGVITWNLSGTDAEFLGGQQKTYTYSYLLGKLDFGRYINTVTVYPESGSSLSDSAEIVADCIITNDEPLPDTALPTESSRIIKIGAILLFLGILWGLLMDMFSSARSSLLLLTKNIGKNIKKANKEKEESNVKKRRNNFEKKVVKK